MNIRKSSLLTGVFVAGLGLLSVIVGMYSYIGEKPLDNALIAVAIMFAGVLLSQGNVYLAKRCGWKRWKAYIVSGVLMVIAAFSAVDFWGILPQVGEARLWFNVAVSCAFSSLMVALFAAHGMFTDSEIENQIRKAFPKFRFVPEGCILNRSTWNADPDFLLACEPQRWTTVRAFVGAGNCVAGVLSAVMANPSIRMRYRSLSFFPEEGTKTLPSGKLIRRCVAVADKTSTEMVFVLDPKLGEGIVLEAPYVGA